MAVTAAVSALVVPLDLNLTDGGFILVQSDRILGGEVPHVDFLSPRPAGSAYLHLLDFALPGPLFAASRTLAVAEVVGYSACLGLLVLGRRLGQVTPAAIAGLCAAALVNLQTFPPFAWHTTDGLLLGAAGLLLIERGLPGRRRLLLIAGAALAGAAAVTKQSFFPVPVIALGRIAFGLRGTEERLNLLVASAAAAAAPGLAYLAAVGVVGGLDELVGQLTGARAVYGKPLLEVFIEADSAGGMAVAVALACGCLVAVLASERLVRRLDLRGPQALLVEAAPRVALTVLVLAIALEDGLRFHGLWPFKLFWIAALTLLATSIRRRRFDYPGSAVIAMAWMASLSWGVPEPSFLAGSLALYVVVRAWDTFPAETERAAFASGLRHPRVVPAFLSAGALVAAVVVAVGFWRARSDRVYLQERGEDVLTAELGGLADPLDGIRTDPATAAYLADVKGCIRRHPAKWTAVLPEDAVSRLAFDLESPFPLDWLWPPEYPGGDRERLIDSARELGRRTDWLVMFQTVPAGVLQGAAPPSLPAADPARLSPFPFDPALTARITAPLEGRRVACGSLAGIYRREGS